MKINNEFWAFVPARSGSKSIKNKNIILLKNKPLLAHSLIAAKKSHVIKNIVFSSDSSKYFDIASKYTSFIPHYRSRKISTDLSSDFDVFLDFVKNFKGNLPKYFLHLRPTTPFRDPKILDKVMREFDKEEKKYTALRSVSKMINPVYKSVIIKNNVLFSPIFKTSELDQINKPRQNYKNSYMPNGYIDIIKTSTILSGLLHGNKVKSYVNNFFVSDIDSLVDLKIARSL